MSRVTGPKPKVKGKDKLSEDQKVTIAEKKRMAIKQAAAERIAEKKAADLEDERLEEESEAALAVNERFSGGTKIRHLKLANSISIGSDEKAFFKSSEYDIRMTDGMTIKVTKLRGGKDTTYTSIFNTISWKL